MSESMPKLCRSSRIKKQAGAEPSQRPMSFEDVAVYFTKGQGALLSPDQRALYKEVMMENYANVSALEDIPVPKPELIMQLEEGIEPWVQDLQDFDGMENSSTYSACWQRHSRSPLNNQSRQKEEGSPPHPPEGDAAEETPPQAGPAVEPEAVGQEQAGMVACITHLEASFAQLKGLSQEVLQRIDALEQDIAQLHYIQDQHEMWINRFRVWHSPQ